MQFRIFEGRIYAFGEYHSYMLTTNGFDEPCQWTWHEMIPEMRRAIELRIQESKVYNKGDL